MANGILITGASGLIGKRLTSFLLQEDYSVSHLSRSKHTDTSIPTFIWDVKKQTIDVNAFDQVNTIINLAGASINGKRWTTHYKAEILQSRTQALQLLFNTLRTKQHAIKTLITASAIGYYGADTGAALIDENYPSGNDYLASVVKAWEDAADAFESLGIRVVKIRIGVVLSEQGGALQAMKKPIEWYVGAPLGSGNQYVSWIHLDDVCRIFIKAINDETMRGAYNGVAGDAITNNMLTQKIAQTINRPLWAPSIPHWLLRIGLGEMASLVTGGNNISSKKIKASGYTFQYPTIESALKNTLVTTKVKNE